MQSQGIKLLSNPTSWATAFVELAGITKLPFPKKSRGQIDMTDLNSPDDYEEIELSKLKRHKDLEFEYNTSQTRQEAVDALMADETKQYFKVTVPGYTKSFWFQGYVIDHDPGEGQVDQKVTGKFIVKPTGKLYFQTAAPT